MYNSYQTPWAQNGYLPQQQANGNPAQYQQPMNSLYAQQMGNPSIVPNPIANPIGGQSQAPPANLQLHYRPEDLQPYNNQEFLCKAFNYKVEYIQAFLALPADMKLKFYLSMEEARLYGEIKDKEGYQLILQRIKLAIKILQGKPTEVVKAEKTMEDRVNQLCDGGFRNMHVLYQDGGLKDEQEFDCYVQPKQPHDRHKEPTFGQGIDFQIGSYFGQGAQAAVQGNDQLKGGKTNGGMFLLMDQQKTADNGFPSLNSKADKEEEDQAEEFGEFNQPNTMNGNEDSLQEQQNWSWTGQAQVKEPKNSELEIIDEKWVQNLPNQSVKVVESVKANTELLNDEESGRAVPKIPTFDDLCPSLFPKMRDPFTIERPKFAWMQKLEEDQPYKDDIFSMDVGEGEEGTQQSPSVKAEQDILLKSMAFIGQSQNEQYKQKEEVEEQFEEFTHVQQTPVFVQPKTYEEIMQASLEIGKDHSNENNQIPLEQSQGPNQAMTIDINFDGIAIETQKQGQGTESGTLAFGVNDLDLFWGVNSQKQKAQQDASKELRGQELIGIGMDLLGNEINVEQEDSFPKIPNTIETESLGDPIPIPDNLNKVTTSREMEMKVEEDDEIERTEAIGPKKVAEQVDISRNGNKMRYTDEVNEGLENQESPKVNINMDSDHEPSMSLQSESEAAEAYSIPISPSNYISENNTSTPRGMTRHDEDQFEMSPPQELNQTAYPVPTAVFPKGNRASVQIPIKQQQHPLLKPLLLSESLALSTENVQKLKNGGFQCEAFFYKAATEWMQRLGFDSTDAYKHLEAEFKLVERVKQLIEVYTQAVEQEDQEKLKSSLLESKECYKKLCPEKTKKIIQFYLKRGNRTLLYDLAEFVVECGVSVQFVDKLLPTRSGENFPFILTALFTMQRENLMQSVPAYAVKLNAYVLREYQKYREANQTIKNNLSYDEQEQLYGTEKYIRYIEGLGMIGLICRRMCSLMKICSKSTGSLVKVLKICKQLQGTANQQLTDRKERGLKTLWLLQTNETLIPSSFCKTAIDSMRKHLSTQEAKEEMSKTIQNEQICRLCLGTFGLGERQGVKVHVECWNLYRIVSAEMQE